MVWDSGIFKDIDLYSGHETSPRIRLSALSANTFNHVASGGLFGCDTDAAYPNSFGSCPVGSMAWAWAPYRTMTMGIQLVF